MKCIKYLAVSLLALSFSQFASAATAQGVNVKFTGANISDLGYSNLLPLGKDSNYWSNIVTVPNVSEFMEAYNYGGKEQVVIAFYIADAVSIGQVHVTGNACVNGDGVALIADTFNNVTINVKKIPKMIDNPRVLEINCTGS